MSRQTITQFLEARIAEDEAAAREVDDITARYFGSTGGLLNSKLDAEDPGHDNPWFVVIDPTRVLAECAAKRAIIADVESVRLFNADYSLIAGHAERQLAHLAAVHSDHADYQQEWAL
jgi:hypothetical protein